MHFTADNLKKFAQKTKNLFNYSRDPNVQAIMSAFCLLQFLHFTFIKKFSIFALIASLKKDLLIGLWIHKLIRLWNELWCLIIGSIASHLLNCVSRILWKEIFQSSWRHITPVPLICGMLRCADDRSFDSFLELKLTVNYKDTSLKNYSSLPWSTLNGLFIRYKGMMSWKTIEKPHHNM